MSDSSDSSDSSRGRFYNPRARHFPPLLPVWTGLPQPLLSARVGNVAAGPSTPGLSAARPGSDSASVSYSSEREVEGEASNSEHDDEDGRRDQRPDIKHGRTQALWVQLQDQRSDARELRARLSEKRGRLRELREQNDETDNSFMGLIRTHLGGGHRVSLASNAVMQRFKEMQSIRGACRLIEGEVEQLEIQLEEVESSREILETQFFSYLHASSGSGHRDPSPPESDADGYAPPSRTSLLGIPADRPVDIHPLYRRLLDAVGDRELAWEHHMDLVMHRDAILYNLDLSLKRGQLRAAEGYPGLFAAVSDEDDFQPWQTTLAEDPDRLDELHDRYKLVIDKEDYDFLKTFSDTKADAEEKLSTAKSEVERLRQLCTENGVMPKNVPYHEEYTVFSDSNEPLEADTMSINEEQNSRPEEEGLANARFPVLLSNPRHVLGPEPLTAKGQLRRATSLARDEPSRAQLVGEAMKEYGISTLLIESAGENKSDYINRWLLHRLRTSPLEAELLYTIFSTKLKVRNMRRWQEDVLYHWSRDKANRPDEALEGPITTRDSFIIDDRTSSDHLNSALEMASRPQSDLGDALNHTSHSPSRPVQSIG